MFPVSSNRFQLIPLEMEVSTAIIKNALAPFKLKNLAAKVVAIAVYPFLLIAAFEAIVINGTRLIINAGISFLNTAYTCWFPNGLLPRQTPARNHQRQLQTIPSLLIPPPVSSHIEIPPPGPTERKKVEFIVTTLAKASYFALWHEHEGTLKQYGEEIENLHPFQFLEIIFGRFSTVKKHMPILMSRSIIPREFLNGLAKGISNPIHSQKASSYMHSFAKKVGSSPEYIHSFLSPTHNWDGLVKHLIAINSPDILPSA